MPATTTPLTVRRPDLPGGRRRARRAAGPARARPRLGGGGATPQAMLDAGFVAVGRDFPVFLHPQTHEEYALARTERKTAPGYRGFAVHAEPGVTLEEDLARRDLTINSIAARADSTGPAGQFDPNSVVDPYGGPGRHRPARAAPCDSRLPRRPGAHFAAWRVLPPALPISPVRPKPRPDAGHGGRGRGGPPGARARVARAGQGPDGSPALPHV